MSEENEVNECEVAILISQSWKWGNRCEHWVQRKIVHPKLLKSLFEYYLR